MCALFVCGAVRAHLFALQKLSAPSEQSREVLAHLRLRSHLTT